MRTVGVVVLCVVATLVGLGVLGVVLDSYDKSDAAPSTTIAATSTTTTTVPPTTTEAPAPVVAAPEGLEWTVLSVFDGATFSARATDATVATVRILGIEVPGVGECWAAESANTLTFLVTGNTLTFTLAGDGPDADAAGRALRYVAATTPAGEVVDVALLMVELGAAAASDAGFRDAQTTAVDSGAGMWATGACPADG